MVPSGSSGALVDAATLRRALAVAPRAVEVPGARAAAVVLPVILDERGARVVLLVRAAGLRDHGGELAFAGGKPEPADASLEATALRELEEELGAPASSVAVLGALGAVPVLDRRFLIHPFVALAAPGAQFRVASPEVEAVYAAPLEALLTGARPHYAVRATWRGAAAIAPHFELLEDDLLDGPPAASRRVLYGASSYVFHDLLTRVAIALSITLPAPIVETALPWGDRYDHVTSR
ncbi:MAG TPA: CoA pyrophosphatase [Byssovorax sp.]